MFIYRYLLKISEMARILRPYNFIIGNRLLSRQVGGIILDVIFNIYWIFLIWRNLYKF